MTSFEAVVDLSESSLLSDKAMATVTVLLEVEDVVRAIQLATRDGRFVPMGALDGALRVLRVAVALAEEVKADARALEGTPGATKCKAVRP